MTVEKTKLIVTGVARSGTTALAELLNSHEEICVGIERFKFRFLREGDYSADLFEKDRFFDFRKDDTNLRPDVRPAWQGVYDTIAEKWDTARIIGDKVPDLTPVLEDLMAANPGVRVIVILRNLKDVGLSWQARADRLRDKWPAGKGFAEACESWDEQYETLQRLVNDPAHKESILLLDYDRIFSRDSRAGAAILAFLGLGASAAYDQTFQSHVAFAAKRPSRKVPPAFVEDYKKIDMTTAQNLRRHARTQTEQWASRFKPDTGPSRTAP